MLCEKCKNDMKITGFNYKIEGDDSPDKKTKLFIVQHHCCRNKECPGYNIDIVTKTEEKI